ncbi:hypothetical protein GCM10010517_59500 [Streptosporangium fragile]|uniref:Uncharacterized protein n=1 Tax=Streptosporangium fragile TaxID=46186 RepID=A0ABP6IL04_9ACTN
MRNSDIIRRIVTIAAIFGCAALVPGLAPTVAAGSPQTVVLASNTPWG